MLHYSQMSVPLRSGSDRPAGQTRLTAPEAHYLTSPHNA